MTILSRKKVFTVTVLAASALALTACASLAPYGPQTGSRGQGYAEQQIENNRFRVTYNGVGAAGPVADRALFRAAQLTTGHGYDWFEITKRWIDGRPDSAGGVRPSVWGLFDLRCWCRARGEFERTATHLDHAGDRDGTRRYA